MNDVKYKFSKLCEKWKIGYRPEISQEKVEEHWKQLKSGQQSLEDLFDNVVRQPNELFQLLEQVEYVYDWGGKIEQALNEIVSRIFECVAPVVKKLSDKKFKGGGILLTGRAFKFKPLENAIKMRLHSMQGIERTPFIESVHDLKKVCLLGVYAKNIILYNDIATTPIEIEKGTLRKVQQVTIPKNWRMSEIKSWIGAFFSGGGDDYDEETNSYEIVSGDLKDVQFLCGGKVYEPLWQGNEKLEEAYLIHSRNGFFIRAKDENEKVHLVPLHRVDHSQFKEQERISKSLFPGWFDPYYLNN